MYICICNALKEGDVRQALAQGAHQPAEIFRHFGAKVCCGKCVGTMRGMSAQGGCAGERRHLSDGHTPAPTHRQDAR